MTTRKDLLMEQLQLLEMLAAQKKWHKLQFAKPYPKQLEFFEQGKTSHERLLMAPNGVGKTEAGAMEMACHLTGEYPKWWPGKRFDRPIRAWAACETSTLTREGAQMKLCGPFGLADDLGSGFIPRNSIVGKPTLSHGVTGSYDTINVQHKTNGIVDGTSTLSFKSYEQGRPKFQAATLDVVWLDEEPPEDIFAECLARIRPSDESPEGGILYMTFTPIKGPGSVVLKFQQEQTAYRSLMSMSVEDALHIPATMYKELWERYPEHEREARYFGRPALGSGAVFQVITDKIKEEAIEEVPLYWRKIWGIDFGIQHPFAAVLLAWDPDTDVMHVLHCFRVKDGLPLQHAVAIKEAGAGVPIAWPQDGTAREKSTGQTLAEVYKAQGLLMLPQHAAFEDGSNSTERGIIDMHTRMKTERFKVAAHLKPWFEEYATYHRKDGLIVKEKDDLMSATRMAVMAKRFSRPGPIGSKQRRVISNKELNSEYAISQRINDWTPFG